MVFLHQWQSPHSLDLYRSDKLLWCLLARHWKPALGMARCEDLAAHADHLSLQCAGLRLQFHRGAMQQQLGRDLGGWSELARVTCMQLVR